MGHRIHVDLDQFDETSTLSPAMQKQLLRFQQSHPLCSDAEPKQQTRRAMRKSKSSSKDERILH